MTSKVETHVDESEIVEILKDLVRINSVNPSLVEGAPGEAEIAEYVANFMQGIGLKTKVVEVKPGRPNVIGVLKGSGGGPTLMLNGHMDTVGIDYMEIDPLNPHVRDGKLYGRGSCDMKGGLAAILSAAKALVDSGTELRGDLVVAGVCDEEYASIGTEKLVEEVRVDAAVIGESTGLQILIAHKGFAWIDIETRGLAAHGSMPDVGVDAIVKMGKVLIGIDRLQEGALQRKRHELVGSPSIHASIIQGGRELSTYPDYCRLQVERRMIPGEQRSDVDAEVKGLLDSLLAEDPKFNGSYRITFVRGPMEVSSDSEICRVLYRSTQEVVGYEPLFIGEGGWLDTEIIWKRGTPAVAFGPTGVGAHAAVEYVDLDSVVDTAKILELTTVRFCGSTA
jgi:acetylornithine deacetylase